MQNKPFPPLGAHYAPGFTCPACEDAAIRHGGAVAGNSMSRFTDVYICSACGTREAFERFFWRENALKRGIALNKAGQAEPAS